MNMTLLAKIVENFTPEVITDWLGYSTIATFILAVLKFLGYIDWSWWLVSAPVLTVLLITIILLTIAFWAMRSYE